MDTLDALLAALRRDPTDATLRAAVADWCQERPGDTARLVDELAAGMPVLVAEGDRRVVRVPARIPKDWPSRYQGLTLVVVP